MLVDRSAVTILDCTLRDGGYYTNWEFAPVLVEEYLAACAAVGVDVIELGYAQLETVERGPYGRLPAGLTPNLLAALPEDHGLRFAVMIDAAAVSGSPPAKVGPRLAEQLGTGSLPVSLVRVAVNFTRTADTAELVASLREAGFGVCLNLMQIGLATEQELDQVIGAVASMGPLEAVYVADSLGSLHAYRIVELVERFRVGQSAPVGIHGHENQGFALHNTLAAADAGATWLDATILGMGRGAGNTRTEQLLPAVGVAADRLRPLLEMAARHFTGLLDKHRWGPSPLYAIAGMQKIHPSYVQRLEQRAEQGQEQKLHALRFLAEARASSFSAALLEDALSHDRG